MLPLFNQQAGDVISLGVLVLVIILGAGAWLADLYDKRHPLPAEVPQLPEPPDQGNIAAEHCSKVTRKRDMADLARGTTDSLVGVV